MCSVAFKSLHVYVKYQDSKKNSEDIFNFLRPLRTTFSFYFGQIRKKKKKSIYRKIIESEKCLILLGFLGDG